MKTLKKLGVAITVICAAYLVLWASVANAQDGQVQNQPDQSQIDQNQTDQNQPQQSPEDQGQQDQSQDQQDPPNRIAQLSYTSGSVSFQPGGTGDWVDAVLNRPLTAGDNLWADQNSRAELHVGSTAIRIDSQTSLTFLDLDDQTTQLRLSAGSLILRVRHLDDGETFEVDTPNLAFDVQSIGEYRVDVNPDGTETDVSVWQGQGEATGGGGSYTVVANQQARFTGTDQLDHEVSQLPSSDDFDTWASQRDSAEDRSDSAKYTSTQMTGYQDLDAYGHWHDVSGYGTVWTPSGIAGDWAPYRYGHWVWIAPWGWTWVEDEPWGFAPFHYGRWAFVGSSWCWVPGPVVARPVYSPAFVAFVGGNGFSLSIGVGGGPGVAWFPLGPGEVYVPYYRASRRYVDNINVTNTRVNVTQITNVYNVYNGHGGNVTSITYVNKRNPRAVTVVSRDTFINARPVERNVVRVDTSRFASAPVRRDVGFQPARTSVVGASGPAKFHPPAKVVDRRVVATRVPRVPQRPAFEQRQPEMNVRQVRRGNAVPVNAPPARAGQRGNPPEHNAPRPVQPEVHNNPNPPNQPNGVNRQPESGRNFPRPPQSTQPPAPAHSDNNAPQGEHSRQPLPYEGRGQNVPRSQNGKPNFPNPRQTAPAQNRTPQQQQNEGQKLGNSQNQRPQRNAEPQRDVQPQRNAQPQRNMQPQRNPEPQRNAQPQPSRPESRPQPSHAPEQHPSAPESHHEERRDQK
jgi:uncharacterized protein DUF6600